MSIKSRLFGRWSSDVLVEKSIRRKYQPGSGVVLMYHEVAAPEYTLPAWTVVEKAHFTEQMEFVACNFDVLTMDQALERTQAPQAGLRPFAVITFDDGYVGNLTQVLPLMEKQKLPFTVYVATQAVVEKSVYWYDRLIGLLGTNRELVFELPGTELGKVVVSGDSATTKRWEQLRPLLEYLKTLPLDERVKNTERLTQPYADLKNPLRMLTAGELKILSEHPLTTIGGHTHSHELLDQLSDAAIIETLEKNSTEIRNITGSSPDHFAYPNGNYDSRIAKLIKNNTWKSAVTTRPGIFSGISPLFEIPRVGVGGFDSIHLFKAKLARWL